MTNVACSWLSIVGVSQIGQSADSLSSSSASSLGGSDIRGEGLPIHSFYYNNSVSPFTNSHFILSNPLPHPFLGYAMTTSSPSVLASHSPSSVRPPKTAGDLTHSYRAPTPLMTELAHSRLYKVLRCRNTLLLRKLFHLKYVAILFSVWPSQVCKSWHWRALVQQLQWIPLECTSVHISCWYLFPPTAYPTSFFRMSCVGLARYLSFLEIQISCSR